MIRRGRDYNRLTTFGFDTVSVLIMRNPFSFPLAVSDRKAEPSGLIVVQIDGLSLPRFEAAIADGSMPYLRSLLNRPAYQLHAMAPGLCCCASCPLAVEPSVKLPAGDFAAGRPSLVRLRYSADEATGRLLSWTRLFVGRSPSTDGLTRIDRALSRIVKRADRGSRHYELWVHARDAFAILPVDAPLPSCCADEGAPVKPSDLRATFERLQNQVSPRATTQRRSAALRRERILRVLSYDVHACLGLDGQWSPARIAQVIEHSGADVVCLQNLDVGHRRGGGNQAKQIEALLQSRLSDCLARHGRRTWRVKFDRYGNAVLSPFAMRLVRTGIAAAEDVRTPRRSMLWVQVDVHGDTAVQFLNAHPLRVPGGQRSGLAAPPSVQQWIEAAATRGTTILCGDGTTDAKSLACRSVASHLVDSTSHALSRINHVFSTDDLALQSAGIVDTPLAKIASDHLPVRVGFWVA